MKCNAWEEERNGSCSSGNNCGGSYSQSSETANHTYNRQYSSASCGGPQMHGNFEPTYYRNFASAVRTCLKDKYATFSGRATRSEFWFFYLFNILAAISFFVIELLLAVVFDGMTSTVIATLFYLGYSLAVIVPGLAVSVRRLHDTGKSGWLLFLVLIPLVGSLVILVFYILGSDSYDNRYGLAPREER